MKRFALSAVVLLFVTGAPALAQQSDRSLTAWIDTLEIDYCQEGRSFDSLGVWVATSTGGDTTVGFQLRDSVLSVTMLLRWDTSTITLTPPYLRIPVQTLLGRFPNRTQFVDTTAGELYITVAADERLRPVIGEGLPLMYLTGRVKVDGELRMPRGGLGIELIEFEGKIDDSLDSKRTLFGFVQVVRDTTPEDPGHLRVEDLNLDTNSRGQVATVVHNVSNRGISTVEVVLAIDTAYARFASVDLEQGWPSLNWEEARLDVRDDTISARFRSDSTITVLDSLLLSIEIDRKSDSAFTTPIDVVRFEVDPFPCGYGVGTDSGTIFAAVLPDDPDTTGSEVSNGELPLTIESGNSVLRVFADQPIGSVILYGIDGRMVVRQDGGALGARRIIISDIRTSGVYIVSVRMKDGNTWNKRLLIQSN